MARFLEVNYDLTWNMLFSIDFFFNFTLYLARRRVGRESLVLRHYAPTFHRILEALRVRWRNSTPHFAFRHYSGEMKDRIQNLSRLQSHACPSAPRQALNGLNSIEMFKFITIYIFK